MFNRTHSISTTIATAVVDGLRIDGETITATAVGGRIRPDDATNLELLLNEIVRNEIDDPLNLSDEQWIERNDENPLGMKITVTALAAFESLVECGYIDTRHVNLEHWFPDTVFYLSRVEG